MCLLAKMVDLSVISKNYIIAIIILLDLSISAAIRKKVIASWNGKIVYADWENPSSALHCGDWLESRPNGKTILDIGFARL